MQAAGDYTTALRLLRPAGCKPLTSAAPDTCNQQDQQEPALVAGRMVQLLLTRAALYEQLEQYGRALEDLREASAWQHPTVDSQVGKPLDSAMLHRARQ